MVKSRVPVTFSADPVADAQSTGRLIASYPNLGDGDLAKIADDKSQALAARIAAVYRLGFSEGFTDEYRLSKTAVKRIVRILEEPVSINDRTMEALESLKHSGKKS